MTVIDKDDLHRNSCRRTPVPDEARECRQIRKPLLEIYAQRQAEAKELTIPDTHRIRYRMSEQYGRPVTLILDIGSVTPRSPAYVEGAALWLDAWLHGKPDPSIPGVMPRGSPQYDACEAGMQAMQRALNFFYREFGQSRAETLEYLESRYGPGIKAS